MEDLLNRKLSIPKKYKDNILDRLSYDSPNKILITEEDKMAFYEIRNKCQLCVDNCHENKGECVNCPIHTVFSDKFTSKATCLELISWLLLKNSLSVEVICISFSNIVWSPKKDEEAKEILNYLKSLVIEKVRFI